MTREEVRALKELVGRLNEMPINDGFETLVRYILTKIIDSWAGDAGYEEP